MFFIKYSYDLSTGGSSAWAGWAKIAGVSFLKNVIFIQKKMFYRLINYNDNFKLSTTLFFKHKAEKTI